MPVVKVNSTKSFNQDFPILAKEIAFFGSVLDEITNENIRHTNVAIALNPDDYSNTENPYEKEKNVDPAGDYLIIMPIKQTISQPLQVAYIVYEEEGGYEGILQQNDTTNCPIQKRDFKLSNKPSCKVIGSVKFCFYGKEAISWSNDSQNNFLWDAVARQITNLRQRVVNFSGPSLVNIVSYSTDGRADAHVVDLKDGVISLGLDFFKPNQLTYGSGEISPRCAVPITAHEFGHLFKETQSEMEDKMWDKLFEKGNQIKNWNRITDQTYMNCHGGHPWDDDQELFASSFNILSGYQSQFADNIAQTTNTSVKTWLKQIYNTQAQNLHIPNIPQLSMIFNNLIVSLNASPY